MEIERGSSVRRLRAVAMAAAAGALTLGGCSATGTVSNGSNKVSPSGSSQLLSSSALRAGADHACIVPGSAKTKAQVNWTALRNPVLQEPDAAVKDQALVWFEGRWHMLFSYVTGSTSTPNAQVWDIATATSSDLVHWSKVSPWPAQGSGGVASPDIVRSPSGYFVSTYDAPPGEQGTQQAKLFYRTSRDLVTWSAPHPLAPALYPDPSVRMIDPALAWTGNGLILAYKVGTTNQKQAFEIAWSPSGALSGPWQVVGRPDITVYGDTVENYELLVVQGAWHLIATSNIADQPWIFELVGDPETPASWLHWTTGYELQVPAQGWDSGPGLSSVNFEHANSAFLCDASSSDGYYYLTYAGSTDLTSFGGWGHAKIGVARSTDLVHWEVP